ncbi:iron ABC transporter permease [Chakrabartyella piscis]|uniref:FecCD family ABC transporter permease n=1 Tax=Chakrabartyella piscis TaxID=2918914 RepID=UPI002958BC9C|nr:iron ABC transporter permease [Chakrabartyella piscis]
MNKKIGAGIAGCLIMAVLIVILTFTAMKLGSIEVTYKELFDGLFVAYDKRVTVIYNLRFPRIIVALLGGASLALSGLLFQAILKNPLADPGIIGISGGAAFTSALVSAIFPMFYFATPIFAFVGGFATFLLIYSLAWKGSLDPLRIILVGIVISAVLVGLTEIVGQMANRTGVSVVVGGLSQLVWNDVKVLTIYSVIGIVGALIFAPACNILALEDKTVRSLGINVDLLRFGISVVAVILVSGITAVVGIVGFLALIAPHIARKLMGSDHKILVPFSGLLGGFLLLLADTIGRIIAAPNEISAAIIMSVLGGPFFIWLLRRGDKHDTN